MQNLLHKLIVNVPKSITKRKAVRKSKSHIKFEKAVLLLASFILELTRGKEILEQLGSARFFDTPNFPALFSSLFRTEKSKENFDLSFVRNRSENYQKIVQINFFLFSL